MYFLVILFLGLVFLVGPALVSLVLPLFSWLALIFLVILVLLWFSGSLVLVPSSDCPGPFGPLWLAACGLAVGVWQAVLLLEAKFCF